MMANLKNFLLLTLTLALLVSCSDSSTGTDPDSEEPTATTGVLEVTVLTTGDNSDEDGYTVTVGDLDPESINVNGSATFSELEESSYSVELSGLAGNCTVDGDNPVSADVTAEETSTIQFAVICEAPAAEAPDVAGSIVFSRIVDQEDKLFIMNADGTGVQRVGNGISGTYPALSPDGTKIAYTANAAIWVVNSDGTNPQQLTTPDEFYGDAFPSWNLDGTKITYQSSAEKNFENSDIYIMNADGSSQTQLTSHAADEENPSWLPDGDKILFSSDRDGDGWGEIWVVDVNSKEASILVEPTVETGINLSDPAWSPNGTRITYQGYISGGASAIYIADADGSNTQSITTGDFSAMQPSWSPNGEHIAFTNLAGGGDSTSDAIWIIKADGTNPFMLTDDQGTYSRFPSWGGGAN